MLSQCGWDGSVFGGWGLHVWGSWYVSEEVALTFAGFDLRVEHAHPHVVKCTQLVRGRYEAVYVSCVCVPTLVVVKLVCVCVCML